MRVRLPDTSLGAPEPRWKRGAIVEVKTQEEVEEIVARGGALVDETEPAAEVADTKSGGKGNKAKGKG